MKRRIAIIAIGFLLAGCAEYYVFPAVEVQTEQVSPTYNLKIKNDLDTTLLVKSDAEREDVDDVPIEPRMKGGGFLISVKKLKLGNSRAPQIIEGPFVEADSSGGARVKLRISVKGMPSFSEPCDLKLDLEHESWFANTKPSKSNRPPELLVCVTECSAERIIFETGPETVECQ